MSTPQHPKLPASSSSGDRRSTASAVPKLRDSCHACASSKLKCHKEKPTCSRCAKRGLVCEYVATKRGGRKHENRQSINHNGDSSLGNAATINETQFLTPISGWFAPNPTVSSADPLPPTSIISPSPRPSTSAASSNLFPSLLSPVDQSLSSTIRDPFADFDDIRDSPISSSIQGISDTDILGRANFFPTGVDSSRNDSANLFDSFPLSEDAVAELFGLSNSHSHSSPNSHASPTSDAQSYQSSHMTESACSCLVSALDLMKQLFPSFSAACTASASQGFDKPKDLPTIETVIAKNEHTIEAVSTMLQCSCSQDSYLLAIVSLIVFKVLGWYAAAARRTPSSGDDDENNNNNKPGVQSPRMSHTRQPSHFEQVLQKPAVVGSYCLDGEDSPRMAGQLVLSELHRVQCLVNQLSAKLKVQAVRSGGGGENKANGSGFEGAESETVLPLSGVMLGQLEVDLRKRLRALSVEIAEGLRRD